MGVFVNYPEAIFVLHLAFFDIKEVCSSPVLNHWIRFTCSSDAKQLHEQLSNSLIGILCHVDLSQWHGRYKSFSLLFIQIGLNEKYQRHEIIIELEGISARCLFIFKKLISDLSCTCDTICYDSSNVLNFGLQCWSKQVDKSHSVWIWKFCWFTQVHPSVRQTFHCDLELSNPMYKLWISSICPEQLQKSP